MDGQRHPQRPSGFPEPSAQEPAPRHRVDEPQREISFAVLRHCFQSAAHVGWLGVQPSEPVLLLASAQQRIGPFGQRDVVVAMPLPQALELVRFAYPFETVGGDGFEEPVSGFGPSLAVSDDDQRAVDKTGQQIKDLVGPHTIPRTHRPRRRPGRTPRAMQAAGYVNLVRVADGHGHEDVTGVIELLKVQKQGSQP